jgi:hypothetical protein
MSNDRTQIHSGNGRKKVKLDTEVWFGAARWRRRMVPDYKRLQKGSHVVAKAGHEHAIPPSYTE